MCDINKIMDAHPDIDLRYGGGVEMMYFEMAMCIKIGEEIPEKTLRARAADFVAKTMEWHENHRWNFEPHPQWKEFMNGKIEEVREQK